MPSPDSRRLHLLVFLEIYCGPTMTFVARQLEELSLKYDITVVANKRQNDNLYTGSPIIVPHDLLSRVIGRITRALGLSYAVPPRRMFNIIRSVHEKRRIDGAICHFGPAGLQIADLLETLDIKQSIIVHGYDGSRLLTKKSYIRQINRSRHPRWIFASNSLERNFRRHVPSLANFTTIHLGIKLPSFARRQRKTIAAKVRAHEKLVFFQASNFVEKKGHLYTLMAFAEFIKKYDNTELVLAGDGPLFQAMLTLAARIGIEPKVKFLGHLSAERVADHMLLADVFLHHSVTASDGDQESIPTVIMEAMGYGVPVISTYHSGIPEIIESGLDGVLVAERDVVGYARAMTTMLTDDGEISAAAMSKVERKFSFTDNVFRIVDFTLQEKGA